MDELLGVLRWERQALEHLLYRLLEAKSLLLADERRFLHLAAEDVEAAAERVREIELRRSTLPVLAGASSLRQIADAADRPLQGILHDHRTALGRIAAEVASAIESLQERCEDAITRLRARAPLGVVGRERRPHDPLQPRPTATLDRLDELEREILLAGFGALRGATRRLTLPAFVAFLD